MKLFLKLIIIILTHKKYINWNKLNQDIAMSLAKSNLLFHPEDDPFRKWIGLKDVKTLVSDS
tara:strand:+ start:718 stop:903 length:186 start_codon:yes stop_codon:yes gene_type:complete